jgi:hypothetical protein
MLSRQSVEERNMDEDTRLRLAAMQSEIDGLRLIAIILGSYLVEMGISASDVGARLRALEEKLPKKKRNPWMRGEMEKYWQAVDELAKAHGKPKKPRRGDA